MNERIQELAEQAESIRLKYDQATMKTERIQEFDKQKFAQLIVLECTKAVMDGTKEGDHYAMRIENHFDNSTGGVLYFGVEE